MASQRFLLELCVCVCVVLAVDGTRFASQKGAAYPDVCAGVANHVMSAVDRLRGSILDVEDRLNKMEATNEETNNRLTRIEATNEETNNRLNKMEATNEETNNRLTRIEAVNEETNNRLTIIEAVNEETNNRLTRIEAVNKETNNRLTRIEAVNKETNNRLTRIEAVNEETNNRLTRIEAVNEETNNRLTRIEAVNEETNNRLTRIEAVNEETNNRLTRIEAVNEETNNRLTRIEAVNEETNNRLTRIEAVNEESKMTMERLEEKLDNITGLLAATPAVKELKEKNVISDKCERGMANVTREPRILVTVLDNIPAVCDTQTDGGGWIIFQRRTNGRENFYRPWKDYETGFGKVEEGEDYWLGLQYIHQITSMGNFQLRIDMEQGNKKYYVQYSSFYVGNLLSQYTLSVGGYTGNATDYLAPHKSHKFSTYDRDNDSDSANCARAYRGAWWYYYCPSSNLNGLWGDTSTNGLYWAGIGTVSFTEMKMRLVT